MYRALPFFLIIMLTGCAFYPKVADSQAYAQQCQMLTRQLELDSQQLNISNSCSGLGGEAGMLCLATLGVVIPAGTILVSGSITLVGNTLHWLEYQGRCPDSFLRKELSAL